MQIFDAPGNVADLVAAVENDENSEGDSKVVDGMIKLNGARDAESDDLDHDVGLDLGGAGIAWDTTAAML